MTTEKLNSIKNLVTAYSLKSPCNEKKVGCVIIDPSDDSILSFGANGNHTLDRCLCNGKDQCMHAEVSAICSALHCERSIRRFSLMCTNSPCTACASLIVRVGITTVYVLNTNSRTAGIEYLRENKVKVYILSEQNNKQG